MKLVILKSISPLETRTPLIPKHVEQLTKSNIEVFIEKDVGLKAHYANETYQKAGAQIETNPNTLIEKADIIVSCDEKQIETLLSSMKQGQTLIATMNPFFNIEQVKQFHEKKINLIGLELVPRITRAQSMDILSSHATLAGYKAVLIAANALTQIFPMLMTSAGTLKPAKVFVMGAGVAGLQACATAKRLGAIVEAYDIREAEKEKIISVGAKPVELNIHSETTETTGGYAKEQSDEFIKQQQQAMTEVLSKQNVIISTASIPGKKAPILITKKQLDALEPGTVIIDLAAETGGNCELTELNKTIEYKGITIIGPQNIIATIPYHASQMFSTNITNLFKLLFKEDQINWDFSDDIIQSITITHEGQVINEFMKPLINEQR